ncbi:MAG: uroporphyrinogen-III synthase, partial [Planctomycetes bacterium]|nr:uroporphyrinogen-III synthase [Planctomycetota bacterium]
IVFTSPSAVRAFAARAHDAKARCIAIGPTTAAALTAAGLRCSAVAATPTAADLIPTLMETCDV